jgi:glycosyltransferase involved in cell wall biosynthesis
MPAPKISVILPVYNAEKFIVNTVQSLLHQTFTDFELIIINDGSTDGSVEKIKAIHDSRIVLIDNHVNQGTATVSNQALERAVGTYIALMDADDISLPERFEKQNRFLDEHPQIGILGTASKFSDTGNVLRFPEEDRQIRTDMFFYYPFRNPTLMLRHEVILKHNLRFDPEFRHTLDYEFIQRMIGFTEAANLNESLLIYTVHSQQISTLRHDIFVAHADRVSLHMLHYLGIYLNEHEQHIHISLKHGRIGAADFGIEEARHVERIRNAKSVNPLFEHVSCTLLADQLHPVRRQFVHARVVRLTQLKSLIRNRHYFSMPEFIKYFIKAFLPQTS